MRFHNNHIILLQGNEMCHENQETIHITKNDYCDMDDVVQKVEEGEKDIAQGKCSSGLDYFDELKREYEV